jgi:RNA polymerase sigma-70 factor (ECF subfamily)
MQVSHVPLHREKRQTPPDLSLFRRILLKDPDYPGFPKGGLGTIGRVRTVNSMADSTPSLSDGAVDLARDRSLVERCQGGDREAFDELYRRYSRRLHKFCIRRLHEPHDAEDAAQETFTRAWRALPGFRGERRFYPWLTVIASNVCTDFLRRESRVTPVEEVQLPAFDLHLEDADAALLRQVDEAMAIAALSHLSVRHQRVLQLKESSGWSTGEIADIEGTTLPAMETLLWRARQALRREFSALAETGSRLVVGIGFAGAALRRSIGRGLVWSTDQLPLLQSVRGSGTLIPSLVLAGSAAVGTAVLVGGPTSTNPILASPAHTVTTGPSIDGANRLVTAAPLVTTTTASSTSRTSPLGAGRNVVGRGIGVPGTVGVTGALANAGRTILALGSAAHAPKASSGAGAALNGTLNVANTVASGVSKALTSTSQDLIKSLGDL